MSVNLLLAILVILRVVGGVAIVFGGMWLIVHNHPTAGGWCIFLGFVMAAISFSTGGDE